MSARGKTGRIHHHIRQELNRRLRDGHDGKRLVSAILCRRSPFGRSFNPKIKPDQTKSNQIKVNQGIPPGGAK
jgi:hypothetical protein